MYYDIKIFEVINGLAGQSKILDLLGIFFAEYLPYLLGMFLLSFLFWPKKDIIKNRAMVLVSIIAGFIARFVVKSTVLFFYNRPRPYMNLSSTHKLISLSPVENLQSFPSGHAIFFFALSYVVYSFNKKLGVFFIFCSTIIGIARIFVGVHWPSDILAGAVLGIIVGFITNWFYIKNRIFINKFFGKIKN
jgi:undecaprenyl-diphosphatase